MSRISLEEKEKAPQDLLTTLLYYTYRQSQVVTLLLLRFLGNFYTIIGGFFPTDYPIYLGNQLFHSGTGAYFRGSRCYFFRHILVPPYKMKVVSTEFYTISQDLTSLGVDMGCFPGDNVVQRGKVIYHLTLAV